MFLFVGINNKLINKVIKCLCGFNCFIHGSSNCFDTFLKIKGQKVLIIFNGIEKFKKKKINVKDFCYLY